MSDVLLIDRTVLLAGTTIVKFDEGVARFSLSVKPTFLGPIPCRSYPALDHQPALFFQGLDQISQLVMQSSKLSVFIADCSEICPAGYILSLDSQTSAGRQGFCTACPPGSYSINPLSSGYVNSATSDPACVSCPEGGDCSKGGSAVSFPIGSWSVSNGIYILQHCPVGYQLINSTDGTSYGTFSGSAQRCAACKQNQYLVHELEQCQPCPSGAYCDGTTGLLYGEPGSYWRREGEKMRVYRCDPGYIMVRDDSNNQEKATSDSCAQCSAMSYSLTGAQIIAPDPCIPLKQAKTAYDCSQIDTNSFVSSFDRSLNGSWVTSMQIAQTLCLPCPAGALCQGGASVIPTSDYWIDSKEANSYASRRRIVNARTPVYKCPPAACGPNNTCAEGRTGPVCGLCLPGWAMSSGGCQRCPTDPSAYQAAATGIAVAGILTLSILLYIFSLRPLFDNTASDFVEEVKEQATDQALDSMADNPEIAGAPSVGQRLKAYCKILIVYAGKLKQAIISLRLQLEKIRILIIANLLSLGFVKVVLGFFQVLSTFSRSFSVAWPIKLSQIFSGSAILSFNFLELPGPSCITTNISHKGKMIIFTIFPFCVIALLMIAPCISWLFCPSRMERVKDSFWYSLMFFLFLIYPTCSVATFSNFNCQNVGSYGALLVSDYSEPCPYPYSEDSMSLGTIFSSNGFVFWWSLVFVIMYPLGIPAFFLAMMICYKIPTLAKNKVDTFKMEALIHLYQKKAMPLEVEILIRQVKLDSVMPCDSKLEQQIRLLFHFISNGKASFDYKDFCNFFKNPILGLPDANELTLRELFLAKDLSGDGCLDEGEFIEMMQQIIRVQGMFTGHETLQDMHLEQLYRLYEFHRNGKLYIEQQNCEEKEKDGWISKVVGGIAAKRDLAFSRIHASNEVPCPDEIQRNTESQYTDYRKIDVYKKSLSASDFVIVSDLLKLDLRTKLLQLSDEKQADGTIAIPTIQWQRLDAGKDKNICSQFLVDEDLAVRHMGFLMETYDVLHWYFEITEMLRKLFMTSLVMFIYPGSAGQLAAALAFTILNMVHCLYAQPFIDKQVGNTHIYALVAQSLTLLYGLMLVDTANVEKLGEKVSYGQKAVTESIATLVVVMNIGIVLVPHLASSWKLLLAYMRKQRARSISSSVTMKDSSNVKLCRDSSLWNNSVIVLQEETGHTKLPNALLPLVIFLIISPE